MFHPAIESKGEEINAERMRIFKEAYDEFVESLKIFAVRYKDEIARSPEQRVKFLSLCRNAGIDPLISAKGIWSECLNIGNHYYELSTQIVDVCISTRNQNGGIIEISELRNNLKELRGCDDISNEEIVSAIEKLNILKSGYSIYRVGYQTLIQSVPNELKQDDKKIIELAQV